MGLPVSEFSVVSIDYSSVVIVEIGNGSEATNTVGHERCQVAPITQKTDFNELLASGAAAGLVPIPGYLVYALRPGATELVLNLLTRGADVAIWSSTPAWIVNPLVEAILPSASDRARLVGVFTQCFHRCDMEGRPLKIVADVVSDARLNPDGARWSLDAAVLIDDCPRKTYFDNSRKICIARRCEPTNPLSGSFRRIDDVWAHPVVAQFGRPDRS